MSVECRPGTAAVAALVIGATIVLALRGVARTEVREAEDRAAGDAIIGPRVRAWYRGLIEPMEAQLAGWGVVFTAWLNYLEGFVIHAWCEFCLASAACVLVLFVLSVADFRRSRALVAS